MSFVLFFMMVPIRLTAVYIRYLLFSTCCQVFANDLLLFETPSSSLRVQNLCQTLIFLSVGREFSSGGILLPLRGMWCNFAHLHRVALGVQEDRPLSAVTWQSSTGVGGAEEQLA